MTNQIQIFNNPQFGDVRVTITENNEPMFCLAGVCKALDLTAKGVKQRLDYAVISNYPIIDALGREQQALYVNEDGLYDTILDSRKPEAKKFRKWVTSEVLPSIRKTGGYMVAKDDESPEDIMARAVLVAQATIERQAKRIAEQSARIEENAPKVAFANAIVASKSSCLIGELAKLITQNGKAIGQNRLFVWMRKNGYLGTRGEQYNIPHQQYIEQGLFELKKGVRSGSDGVMKTTITPKVTAKGQQYFINKFLTASCAAC
ncbi:MAG: phage antirepressor KilAC domain-containing protein [Duncaniella sp.]|nr:phage antirepressor KilAC domain-containing protein [Duncaniella sp.]